MGLAFLDVAPPSVNNYVDLKLKFGGPSARWTEKLQMANDTPANIAQRATRLINARTRLLALNFYLESAIFSYQNVLRDGYPAVGTWIFGILIYDDVAAATETVIAPCNNSESGFEYRFQASNGHFDLRLLRGIRDPWITGNTYDPNYIDARATGNTYAVGGPYLGTTAPDPTYTDGTDTATQLLHNYLSLVRDNTQYYRPDPDVPGNFLQYVYQYYAFSRTASRQTGVVTDIPRGRQRSFA